MSGRSKKVKIPSGVNAPKTSRQRRAKNTRSSPASVSTTTLAPAAVSSTRKASDFTYSNVRVGGRSALRVGGCIPIAEIGNDSKNNGLYIQGFGTFSATTASVCDCTPYDFPNVYKSGSSATSSTLSAGSWISPHLPLLALAFDRYAMVDVMFSYEPQSTSTAADRLVFAWTDDPFHPFLSCNGLAALSTLPTQLGQLVTKDSVAFAPWTKWSLRVPVARDIKYLFDQDVLAQVAENARFSQFGSFSCIGSAAPASPIVYGILYASFVIDLIDPVPIVNAVGISTLLAGRPKRSRDKVQMMMITESKRDSHSISPSSCSREDMDKPTEPATLTRHVARSESKLPIPTGISTETEDERTNRLREERLFGGEFVHIPPPASAKGGGMVPTGDLRAQAVPRK